MIGSCLSGCFNRPQDLVFSPYTMDRDVPSGGAPVPASWTGESVGPPTRRQIPLAGLFGGELALKRAHVRGKGRTRHARTLHLVAC